MKNVETKREDLGSHLNHLNECELSVNVAFMYIDFMCIYIQYVLCACNRYDVYQACVYAHNNIMWYDVYGTLYSVDEATGQKAPEELPGL